MTWTDGWMDVRAGVCLARSVGRCMCCVRFGGRKEGDRHTNKHRRTNGERKRRAEQSSASRLSGFFSPSSSRGSRPAARSLERSALFNPAEKRGRERERGGVCVCTLYTHILLLLLPSSRRLNSLTRASVAASDLSFFVSAVGFMLIPRLVFLFSARGMRGG